MNDNPAEFSKGDSTRDGSSLNRSRSLVIFHFFEKDATYVANLAHFLLFGYSRDTDYVIVVAGEHTVQLPSRQNIRYIHTENGNSDYGGYCSVMESLGGEVLNYDFIYFVNSSVRGPFLPSYIGKDWKTIFSERLTGDVGLVGSTINILAPDSGYTLKYQAKYQGRAPYSHVQTMAYAMPRRSLAHLLDAGFFSQREVLDKHEVIIEYEVRLSQLILSAGWNISALLPEYRAIDYREQHAEINPHAYHVSRGDPNFRFAYFGRTMHPFEVVFIKTNRQLLTEAYLDRLTYSGLSGTALPQEWTDTPFIMEYVDRIMARVRSLETSNFSDQIYSVDDILELADLLLQQRPDARVRLEQVLQRHSAA